jgi:hypothetical protein
VKLLNEQKHVPTGFKVKYEKIFEKKLLQTFKKKGAHKSPVENSKKSQCMKKVV